MNEVYETKITNARWILYDIPGNIGWITYFICVVIALKNDINCFSVLCIIPKALMLVGIVELISERFARLDRVLPKKRLIRGFGALMSGGAAGIIISFVGLTVFDDIYIAVMLVGALLCFIFSFLLFRGYKKNKT